jgi:hypothetical protein
MPRLFFISLDVLQLYHKYRQYSTLVKLIYRGVSNSTTPILNTCNHFPSDTYSYVTQPLLARHNMRLLNVKTHQLESFGN